MQDVLYIESLDQAAVLMKPARVDVLRCMAAETTCTEIGKVLGQTPQRVYHHVKALESAGLVERVSERRVRGIAEGIYCARARSYWLSPKLVGQVGGPRATRDHASLGHLVSLAEEIQEDVGRLAQRVTTHETPSLGLDAHIELADAATRQAFLQDVQDLFAGLAEKYGASTKAGATFRLALACYPEDPPPTKKKGRRP